MQQTLTPETAHATIEIFAKKMALRTGQKVRRWEPALKKGEWVRQGDVMLVQFSGKIPEGYTIVPATSEYQLAQGNTMGSRHMLIGGQHISFYRHHTPGPLDGGIIIATDRMYVSHPEHDHMDLAKGAYQCVYQTDLSADELRAVRD